MMSLKKKKRNFLPEDSLTYNNPMMWGRLKHVLYVSFPSISGELKWYHFNLGGSVAEENHSSHELITTLLDEASQNCFRFFIAGKSSIYSIGEKGTNFSFINKVQVLETKYRKGLPSWKQLPPLVKSLIQPKTVTLGSKIYVVGVDAKDGVKPFQIKDIEVLSGFDSTKWKLLPLNIPDIGDWYSYFVAAFDDNNQIVIGSASENRLYLYDVSTHELEKLNVDNMHIPCHQDLPPVVVGNNLFWFVYEKFFAFNLVEKYCCVGKIDGIDNSLMYTSKHYSRPKLIYLGGSELCLICIQCRTPYEGKSFVRFFIFSVPEFIERDGSRSLQGRVHSSYMYAIEYTDQIVNMMSHCTNVH